MKVGADPAALLQAFRSLSGQEGTVHTAQGPEGSPVLAVGRTDDNREVQWVSSTGDTQDDAALELFLGALDARYGGAIGQSVANELGLVPGKPLEAREVALALEMAENHVGVYEGINFLTQANLSGQALTPGFRAACEAQGINPALLSGDDRGRIDAAFQRAFQDAAAGGTHRVSEGEAAQLLQTVLARFQSGEPL